MINKKKPPIKKAVSKKKMVKKKAPKKKVAKKEKVVKAVGRPSVYSDKIAKIIFLRLSDGESLRQICTDEKLPCRQTVLNWLFDNEEFLGQYERSKQEGLELRAEEILEIADDGRNDYMEKQDKDGKTIGYIFNAEHVQRSRLRIDSRKWLLSKLIPKKYGDSVNLNHGGQDGNPLMILAKSMQGASLTPNKIKPAIEGKSVLLPDDE